MPVANVVCMKWGDKYPSHYVNQLYAGVSRFLRRPFRFVCFTDDPSGILPEVEIQPMPKEPFEDAFVRIAAGKRGIALRKVSLFRPGLAGLQGPVLGFDVDVAITGPLDDLFDFAPGKICMRRDWLEKRRMRPGGHGSVFRYDPELHSYVFEEFAADPEGRAAWAKGSEQKYTSLTALAHGDLEYFPPEWISSFKRNSLWIPPLNHLFEPRLPADTRVLCFHGRPKLEEALRGREGPWYLRSLPASWLGEFWNDESVEGQPASSPQPMR